MEDVKNSCPNCGFCPHCGRSNGYWTMPYVPYVPYYPIYPSYPPAYPTWSRGTAVDPCQTTYTITSGTQSPEEIRAEHYPFLEPVPLFEDLKSRH